MLSRRGLLAGAASLVAARALADDLRPLPRVAAFDAPDIRPFPRPPVIETLDTIFARSGLERATGFALADLDTGEMLEELAPDVPRPPASVQKLVTALYALETLGHDHRFATRLLSTGLVEAGTLRGDLILSGGGDPSLDTDALGRLAAGLMSGGVRAVEGRFLVSDGALPAIEAIDPDQPADAAYNPGLAGINLNFNRAFASWRSGGSELEFSAPGDDFETELSGIRGGPGDGPLAVRNLEDDVEAWSLPARGLRRPGSMWLPVGRPGRYAGEVFRALAGQRGLVLPQPEMVRQAEGALVGLTLGPRLEIVLRGMMRYSTNLTSEVVGLAASSARGGTPASLATSAAGMARWAEQRGLRPAPAFANHSGLSADSRVIPAALVRFLRAVRGSGLPALMPARPILDSAGDPIASPGVTVWAKTGTLDFVRGLSGYLTGRRRLGFAILAADLARRSALGPVERAYPSAAVSWSARAREQEYALLRRWVALHAS